MGQIKRVRGEVGAPQPWPADCVGSRVSLMKNNPDFDDKDLVHEPRDLDPLGEIYSELVTPDIEEMNEHAAALAAESETESDSL